jgi:hypothetical protein
MLQCYAQLVAVTGAPPANDQRANAVASCETDKRIVLRRIFNHRAANTDDYAVYSDNRWRN